MKSRTVEIPKPEPKKESMEKSILRVLKDKPMSAGDISFTLKYKVTSLAPRISKMVTDRTLETIQCPNCHSCKLYRLKNRSLM